MNARGPVVTSPLGGLGCPVFVCFLKKAGKDERDRAFPGNEVLGVNATR